MTNSNTNQNPKASYLAALTKRTSFKIVALIYTTVLALDIIYINAVLLNLIKETPQFREFLWIATMTDFANCLVPWVDSLTVKQLLTGLGIGVFIQAYCMYGLVRLAKRSRESEPCSLKR